MFLARLAADGLWLFEATRPAPLAPEVKEALIRRIAALTEPPTAHLHPEATGAP
ncbi:MAG TPA: hypothetical protein VJ347_07865 [Streptosporangiaceae bacterium]|nr:hypothetical protein [Streptosporangiaceae bacterium]